MSYLWFQYKEAGSYPNMVSFRPYAANLYNLPVTAPKVDKPQTIHFILQVKDKGTPALGQLQESNCYRSPELIRAIPGILSTHHDPLSA